MPGQNYTQQLYGTPSYSGSQSSNMSSDELMQQMLGVQNDQRRQSVEQPGMDMLASSVASGPYASPNEFLRVSDKALTELPAFDDARKKEILMEYYRRRKANTWGIPGNLPHAPRA